MIATGVTLGHARRVCARGDAGYGTGPIVASAAPLVTRLSGKVRRLRGVPANLVTVQALVEAVGAVEPL